MAVSSRWNMDLGLQSGGNLPKGTTGKAFCQHVWKALLAAMRDLGDGYHCVLGVGAQADALDFLGAEVEGDVPGNVSIRSCIQQVEMLNSYADVFVSHAGFNSMQESLMAGVPLIAVPQAMDQPENARKIEVSGWGRAFLEPMTTLTPAALAAAVREVSADASPYLAEVSRVKGQLQGGHQRAADRLLQLAAKPGARL
uniref:Erythromycin biosynthesis protein CIII-like C-terminal domain-containing protein n=1 Tax=Pyrodinium bahamense TaxID=73915 RepID=A0A7S0A214_9DINO